MINNNNNNCTNNAHGRGKGLRRVNLTTLSYSTKSGSDECWEEGTNNAAEGMSEQSDIGMWDDDCNEMGTSILAQRTFAQNLGSEIDEQTHQQLVANCATVHRQVRTVLHKLAHAVEAVNAKDGDGPRNACELLRTYERTIWPSIVEADLNIKSLSNSVREIIDACKINEPRLEWLLRISKFRVTMENAISSAIGVCAEIERVLRIRVRGEVRGVRITEQTVALIKGAQNEIIAKRLL